MQPLSSPVVDQWISAVYLQKGQPDEAVHYDLLEVETSEKKADTNELLALYRRSGWSAYWLARSAHVHNASADPCLLYGRGRFLLRAGHTAEAWTDLKEAADRHCYWAALLPADPELDPYRTTPSYASVTAKLDLPATTK